MVRIRLCGAHLRQCLPKLSRCVAQAVQQRNKGRIPQSRRQHSSMRHQMLGRKVKYIELRHAQVRLQDSRFLTGSGNQVIWRQQCLRGPSWWKGLRCRGQACESACNRVCCRFLSRTALICGCWLAGR